MINPMPNFLTGTGVEDISQNNQYDSHNNHHSEEFSGLCFFLLNFSSLPTSSHDAC